ncbi:ATP-dependent DNA helicase PIF1-like protein [Tanacetum coccineum]|uniref:ATP-dependent DNA helicase n=1 Tax=Tanacetum coccineum TaxID=301880 RepID=A0ABQ5AQS8_9ASTR
MLLVPTTPYGTHDFHGNYSQSAYKPSWIYSPLMHLGQYPTQVSQDQEVMSTSSVPNYASSILQDSLWNMDTGASSHLNSYSNLTLYRSLASGLQYVTFTRPNLSYVVQQIFLYMHDPWEPHLAALKRILRYVQGTLQFGLPSYMQSFRIFCVWLTFDVDWAGCPEAEYRGVANVVAETAWLNNLFRELYTQLLTATLLYCDNAYGNVDFESGTVNQVIITSLCHGGFDDVADSFIQGSQEPDPNPLRSAFKRLQKKIVKSKTKHLNLLKITFCRSKELTKTSYDLLGWMALRIEPESSYGSHLLSQVKQEELVKEMINQFLLARVTSLNNQQEWETMKKLPVATEWRRKCTPGIRNYEWEYRWMDYPLRARDVSHRCDQSVSTLIRCYFSTEYRQAHRIAAYGEGNLMHCTTRGNTAYNFLLLKEGAFYSVRNFSVQPNKEDFRVMRFADFMLEFDGDIRVRKSSVKSEGFNRYPFQFVEIDDLEPTNNKYLIDVAGYVTNVGRTTQQKTGSTTLDFHLANRSTHITFSGAVIFSGDPRPPTAAATPPRLPPHYHLHAIPHHDTTIPSFPLPPPPNTTTTTTSSPPRPHPSPLRHHSRHQKPPPSLRHPHHLSHLLLVTTSPPPGCLSTTTATSRTPSPPRVRLSFAPAGHILIDDEKIPVLRRLKTDDSNGLELTKEVLPGDNTLPKPGTLGEKCKNGNISRKAGQFWCGSCDSAVEYPVLRYRLELEIFDDTAEVVVIIFDETTTSLLKCFASAMVASQAQVFFCTPFNLLDTHTDLRLQDEDEHSGLPVALANIFGTSQTLELKSHKEELEDFDAEGFLLQILSPKGMTWGVLLTPGKKEGSNHVNLSSLSNILHTSITIHSNTIVRRDGNIQSFCGLKLSDIHTPNIEPQRHLQKAMHIKKKGNSRYSRSFLSPNNSENNSCNATMWYEEGNNKGNKTANLTFSLCCQEGKVLLSRFNETPEPLRLLDYSEPVTSRFRNQIRVYNDMFCFTSFGAGIDHSINVGRGLYTFRINGQNYHRIGSLLPQRVLSLEVATLITKYFRDGDPTKDIIVNTKYGRPKRISELHPSYMALQYPLLFPYGEDGYHDKILYYRNTAGLGKRIFLPHTFTGGPRYMMQNYQDAMALCRAYGNPDLFFIFMSNPKWPKINEMLAHVPGQRAHEWPEVGIMVFKLKLTELLDDLTKNKIFKESQEVVCVIEVQKRGLPHAHILLWLKDHCKCRTSGEIDDIISTELPSPMDDPAGYKAVIDYMLHDPCGKDARYAPCLDRATVVIQENVPNGQAVTTEKVAQVTLRDSECLPALLEREGINVIMFTDWFTLNERYPPARARTYAEIPQYYVWYERLKIWKPQKQRKCIGRIVYSIPASGERYFLWMLLNVVRGPQNFDELLTLTTEHIQNYCLVEIQEVLNRNGRSLAEFQDLPRPNPKFLTNMDNRLIREALEFDMNKSIIEHQQLHSQLNPEQRLIYEEVVESAKIRVEDCPCRGLFRDCILAATSRKDCSQQDTKGYIGLPNTHKQEQNLWQVDSVAWGNFRQILSVIPKGKRSDIVQACINRSKLWKNCKVFTLTRSMRVNEYYVNGELDTRKEDFNQCVLAVSDGKLPTKMKDGEDGPTWIQIPEKFLINPSNSLIAQIVVEMYPNFIERQKDDAYLKERAILTPINDDADAINAYMFD